MIGNVFIATTYAKCQEMWELSGSENVKATPQWGASTLTERDFINRYGPAHKQVFDVFIYPSSGIAISGGLVYIAACAYLETFKGQIYLKRRDGSHDAYWDGHNVSTRWFNGTAQQLLEKCNRQHGVDNPDIAAEKLFVELALKLGVESFNP